MGFNEDDFTGVVWDRASFGDLAADYFRDAAGNTIAVPVLRRLVYNF